MSSCRATSFYVAPGKKYDFATSTLCTYEGVGETGHFVEFSHRKDLERYERGHPQWDGVCYVGPGGGPEALVWTLATHPEQVEKWKIDSRVVNGRAPAGPAHVLYNLSVSGVKKAGGLPNVLGVFPGANKPLASAVVSAAQNGDGLSLSLALALRDIVGDDVAARIAAQNQFSQYYGFSPVDSALVKDAFARLSERYGKVRALTLIEGLANDLNLRWLMGPAHAAEPDSPTVSWIMENGSEGAKRILAQNKKLTPELADALSRDASKTVRETVAKNPNLSSKIVALNLLRDDDLAAASAANPTLSEETIRELATDTRVKIRAGAASNRSAPPDLLEELSYDIDPLVRRAVARNRSTPPLVLAALAEMTTGGPVQMGFPTRNAVVNEALRNINIPLGDLQRLTRNTRDGELTLARNEAMRPDTSPERLAELAQYPNTQVRFFVGVNKNTPLESLRALANDPDPTPRRLVGENLSLDLDERVRVLRESIDPDSAVTLAHLVKQHPGTGSVTHPAWAHLTEVLANDDREKFSGVRDVTWPKKPRSIHELPARDAMGWDIDERIAGLEGRPLGEGLSVKVLSSKQDLKTNANYMGNCTAGYGRRVASGRSVVLALVDAEGVTQYNAAFEIDPRGSLDVGEVNSRFNRGNVPSTIHDTLAVWAKELGAKTTDPVAAAS